MYLSKSLTVSMIQLNIYSVLILLLKLLLDVRYAHSWIKKDTYATGTHRLVIFLPIKIMHNIYLGDSIHIVIVTNSKLSILILDFDIIYGFIGKLYLEIPKRK